jgi:hypothetical protein
MAGRDDRVGNVGKLDYMQIQMTRRLAGRIEENLVDDCENTVAIKQFSSSNSKGKIILFVY